MKKIIATIGIIVALLSMPLVGSGIVSAVDCSKDPTAAGCPCAVAPNSATCKELKTETTSSSFSDRIKNIVNVLLFGISIVAVIMIIISAIRFTSSRGDPETVKKARLTIAYSIAGLVVAISSWAIINFVIKQL